VDGNLCLGLFDEKKLDCDLFYMVFLKLG